jgi:hypothetical protein
MDPKCIEFGLTESGCNAISPGLYVAYILFGIALLAAIVLPLINTLKNPSVLVKSGISLGVLVVLFAISYALADGKPSAISTAFGVPESSVKLISAGIIMFYIAMLVAALGVIYSEINKALK